MSPLLFVSWISKPMLKSHSTTSTFPPLAAERKTEWPFTLRSVNDAPTCSEHGNISIFDANSVEYMHAIEYVHELIRQYHLQKILDQGAMPTPRREQQRRVAVGIDII